MPYESEMQQKEGLEKAPRKIKLKLQQPLSQKDVHSCYTDPDQLTSALL